MTKILPRETFIRENLEQKLPQGEVAIILYQW